MAIRLNPEDFQSILSSRNWVSFCGVEPTTSHYEEYLKILPNFSKNLVQPTFEDFFTFCLKLCAAKNETNQNQFLQDYVRFTKHNTSEAWPHFSTVFKRQPTFMEYVEFLNISAATNWGIYQCPLPKFENYLGYLIERDNVSFDWVEVCGHVPTLMEYMVYLGLIEQVDWAQMNMSKPSFRQVLEEGAERPKEPPNKRPKEPPNEPVKEELEDGEITDGDSPPQSVVEWESVKTSSGQQSTARLHHGNDGAKHELSPKRQRPSPRRPSISPKKRTKSPGRYPVSPDALPASPGRIQASPDALAMSPGRLPVSPRNRLSERAHPRNGHDYRRRSREEALHAEDRTPDPRSPLRERSPLRGLHDFEIRSPARRYSDRDSRSGEAAGQGSSDRPATTAGYNNEATQKWRTLMAECEKARFDHSEESKQNDADNAETSLKEKTPGSDDMEPEAWCSQCGVQYSKADEKAHRRLYHEHKTEVFRCWECGWDHASYAMLQAHYDASHGHLPPVLRKPRCRVPVPSIVLLPSCRTCGYGSLIPFANSYHSCEQLPMLRDGCLVIDKKRECPHDSAGESNLCARCASYFSPPLPQIRYHQGQFIIDVEKGGSSSAEATRPRRTTSEGDGSDRELSVDVEPIDEKTSTLGSELKKLFSPLRRRKDSVASNVEAEASSSQKQADFVEPEPKEKEDTETEHGAEKQCESRNEEKGEEENEGEGKGEACEKMYKCEECDAKFNLVPNLRKHRKKNHTLKDQAFRCRDCGSDFVFPQALKQHYQAEHDVTPSLDKAQHAVYAKPYVHVPRCPQCRYQSCIPHVIKYHQCSSRPVYDKTKIRIKCPNLCTHKEEAGDFCPDCLARFTPTERRVKYDCDREEFVITVREKLVFSKEESEDGSDAEDDNASDASRPDTSDESDEDEATKVRRAKFNELQNKSAKGFNLHECRFCGKKKSKRTLLLHIKKFHCTKFQLLRCHLCGFDAPTFPEVRSHWKRYHDFYDFLPREEVEYISEPYQQVPVCRNCNYQTLIPYALQLHSCEQLPVLRDGFLEIEKTVKCEHAQDIKYSYGLGATSSVCADCLHLFVPNPEKVKLENGVFKIQVTQKLTRDDPEFQAQRDQRTEEKNKKVGMGAGLLVSKRRLKDHSCTDLVTGIDLKERYFCVVHAKEFQSAEALIQHNYTMHARQPITEAYRCFICAYDGHNFMVAKKHVLQFHKDECVDNTLFIVKVTVTGNPKIPMCKTCGFASMDNEIFKSHECYFWRKDRQEGSKANRHMCKICKTAFKSEQHVKAHIEDLHTKWMRVFRCFACGYDSSKFDIVREHISENHVHNNGTLREEHCSMAVPEYFKIPSCKKCGFATLIAPLFKAHKCHFWPEKFFQNSVAKEDKPGPHNKPMWSETVDNRMKLKSASNVPSLMDLPAMPLTWKPLSHRKMNSKEHKSSSSSRSQPGQASSKHRPGSSSAAKQDARHAADSRTPPRQRDREALKRRAGESERDRARHKRPRPGADRDQYREQNKQYGHASRIDQRSHSEKEKSPPVPHPYSSSQQFRFGREPSTRLDTARPDTADYGNNSATQVYNYERPRVPSQDADSGDLLKQAWENYYQYCENQNTQSTDAYQYWNQDPTQSTNYSGQLAGDQQKEEPATNYDFSTLEDRAQQSTGSDTKCEHCFAVLATAQAREEHIYDQHEVKTCAFRCPTCYFDSSIYATFRNHFKKKHRSMKRVNISEGAVKIQVEAFTFVPLCPRGCGFASLDPNAMRYHRCYSHTF